MSGSRASTGAATPPSEGSSPPKAARARRTSRQASVGALPPAPAPSKRPARVAQSLTLAASPKESAKAKEVFELWWKADRQAHVAAREGNTTEEQVQVWAKAYRWHERADLRDHDIARAAERKAARRIAEMRDAEVEAGLILREAGVRDIKARVAIADKKAEESGEPATVFDRANEAITSIKEGFNLQRQGQGLPNWVGVVQGASTEELLRIVRDHATRAAVATEAEDTIEGEIVSESDAG